MNDGWEPIMIRKFVAAFLLSIVLAGTALAQSLPDYYPDSFRDAGRVDAVYFDEKRIVIGDISYWLAESVVVYSRSSAKDSILRVREGTHVGFKRDGAERITAIWLLPDNFDPFRRR